MTITWAKFTELLEEKKTEFEKLYKCLHVSRTRKVSTETFDRNLNDIIEVYNAVVKRIVGTELTGDHLEFCNRFHAQLRDKLLKLFTLIKVRIEVPFGLIEVDPQVVVAESSDTESEMVLSPEDFLSLAGRTIPHRFAGDVLARPAFINSIKLLEKMSGATHLELLVTFLMTKLESIAMEAVPAEPKTVQEIIDGLMTIKPDSSKVVASRLRSLRFDRTKVQDFTEEATKLGEALQRALILEGVGKEKAREMTVEETKDMCRSNTNSDFVKAVVSASQYHDPDEVVAKLILETSAATRDKQVLAYKAQYRGKRGKKYRGNNGNNYGKWSNGGNQYQSQYQQGGNGRGNYRGRFNYRGRGRGRGNYQNHQGQSVRVIEALGNEQAPQQYQQLGEMSIVPYQSR